MDELQHWLSANGLAEYHARFEALRLDLNVLAELTDDDLAELDMPLGDRVRLRRAIETLRKPATEDASSARPAERRLATVVFIDLVGSTAMGAEMSLEVYRDAMVEFQSTAKREIEAAGGFLAQFQGDGALACFGFPTMREDSAVSAVEAALTVVRVIAAIDAFPVPLRARAGIASGEVLIGDLSADWTAGSGGVVGDAANLASRLEAAAAAEEVLICGETQRLVSSEFRCSPRPTEVMKGFRAPVTSWLVEERSALASRFEARNVGDLGPLIGRELQLRIIEEAWDRAKSGEGQAVFLHGEAGIGKSRLVREFVANLRPESVTSTMFQCRSGYETSPFRPVVDWIVRGAASSEPKAQRAFLAEQVAAAGLSPDAVEDIAAALLGENGHAEPDSDDERRGPHERCMRALVALARGLARDRPVCVVIEDLHWIDPSTLELIERLTGALENDRLLLLCTTREDELPVGASIPELTSIRLQRLSRRLASKLANLNSAIPAQLEDAAIDAIVQRAGGVPLFIVELTRAVGEGQYDLSGQSFSNLPTTLRELLEARIDAIEVPREIAAYCAAMVQEFQPRVVADASGFPLDALRQALETMRSLGVIMTRGQWPDLICRFSHAMYRDAAYHAMLSDQRKRIHGDLARAIEAADPAVGRREPEALAHHLELAGAHQDAVDYWVKAAERAVATWADAEAIARFEAALRCAARIDDSVRREALEIAIRHGLRLPLERRAWGSPALAANLERLLELEGGDDDGAVGFELVHGLFGRCMIAGDIVGAARYVGLMRKIAGRTDDPSIHAMTLHKAGMCAFQAGDFTGALTAFDDCLEYRDAASLKEIGQYYAPQPWAVAHAMSGWASAALNRPEETRRHGELAIAEAEDWGDPFTTAFSHGVLATACAMLGDTAGAMTHSGAVLRLAEAHDIPYWTAWCQIAHGWARAASGNEDAGLEELKRGVEAYAETGSRQLLPFANLLLAECCLRFDRRAEARQTLKVVEELEADLTVRAHVPFKVRLMDALTATV